MAQNNNNQQNAIEEKKSIGQRIKELLVMWIFRNSIAQRLDEIADQLDEAAKQGDLMQEDIENLSKVVDKLAGKLRNTSPEEIEQTKEEVAAILENYTQELYNKGKIVDGTTNEPDFYAAVKELNVKYKDMSFEAFKKYFNQNAILYDTGDLKTKDGAIEGTTSLLIELDGECYKAEFDVSTINSDGESSNNDKKERKFTLSVAQYEGNYADSKEIRLNEEGAYETMMRSFLKSRDLRRKGDIRKYDLKKLAKENRAIRDFAIITKFDGKVTETPDGCYEMTFDSKKGVACIREKETNKAIVVSSDNSGVSLKYATNVKSLENYSDISGEKIGGWTYSGKGQIVSTLKFSNDDAAKIFNTKTFLEFIEMYGINTGTVLNGFNMKHDTKPVGFSKTEDAEALNRVDRLRMALDEVVNSKKPEEIDGISITDNRRKAWYDIKNKTYKDRAAVYLSVEDKQSGYSVSFHFDKNGESNCINYRKTPLDEEGNPKLDKRGKPIKPNFRFLQDFTLHQIGKDFCELKNDPEFLRVYEIACEARDLYRSRENIIEKATKEETMTEEPEIPETVPEETALSQPEFSKRKETKKGLFNRFKNKLNHSEKEPDNTYNSPDEPRHNNNKADKADFNFKESFGSDVDYNHALLEIKARLSHNMQDNSIIHSIENLYKSETVERLKTEGVITASGEIDKEVFENTLKNNDISDVTSDIFNPIDTSSDKAESLWEGNDLNAVNTDEYSDNENFFIDKE